MDAKQIINFFSKRKGWDAFWPHDYPDIAKELEKDLQEFLDNQTAIPKIFMTNPNTTKLLLYGMRPEDVCLQVLEVKLNEVFLVQLIPYYHTLTEEPKEFK